MRRSAESLRAAVREAILVAQAGLSSLLADAAAALNSALTNFPTTAGAHQTTLRGSKDGFVAKTTDGGRQVIRELFHAYLLTLGVPTDEATTILAQDFLVTGSKKYLPEILRPAVERRSPPTPV